MTMDQLATAVPIDLGRSRDLVLTQQMVDTHAGTTGDAQWIHNDPARARRESPFGGPIAQGFLLLSLLTQLSSGLDLPAFGPVSMLVNYGFDRVRFLQPVPVGASVYLHGELSDVRPRGDGSAVLRIDAELWRSSTGGDDNGSDGSRLGRLGRFGRSDAVGAEATGPCVAARWLFLAVPA